MINKKNMKRILLLGLLGCSYLANAQQQSLYMDVFNSSSFHNITAENFSVKKPGGISSLRAGLGYERRIFKPQVTGQYSRWSLVTELKLRNIGYTLENEYSRDYEYHTTQYQSPNKLTLLEAGVGIKYDLINARRWSVGSYILARPQYFFANRAYNDDYILPNSEFYMTSYSEKLNKIGFAGSLGANVMYNLSKRSSLGLNASYTHGFISLMNLYYEQQLPFGRNDSYRTSTTVESKGSGWDIGFRYRYTLK